MTQSYSLTCRIESTPSGTSSGVQIVSGINDPQSGILIYSTNVQDIGTTYVTVEASFNS